MRCRNSHAGIARKASSSPSAGNRARRPGAPANAAGELRRRARIAACHATYMHKTLWVFLDDNFAGTLACDSAGLSFQYDRAWLDNRAFLPLSVTLPRAVKRSGHRDVYPYFENLLPEEK